MPGISQKVEVLAALGIATISIFYGLDLVLEWAMIHKAELLEDWRLCGEKTPPNKIDPLA